VADVASKPCTGEVPPSRTRCVGMRPSQPSSSARSCARRPGRPGTCAAYLPAGRPPAPRSSAIFMCCESALVVRRQLNVSTTRYPTPGVVSITGGFTVSATETTFVAQLGVARQRFGWRNVSDHEEAQPPRHRWRDEPHTVRGGSPDSVVRQALAAGVQAWLLLPCRAARKSPSEAVSGPGAPAPEPSGG
jgi:hypothetical protein